MKKLILFSILFSSLCAVPAVPSYFQQDTSDCMEGMATHGYVRHREHEGVGYKTGYTTVGGFITPNTLRPFQPFLDLRAHIMNDGKWAANTGVGFRHAPVETFAWGMNAFFDYRQVKHLPSRQAGVGVEFLSQIVDVRLNGYFPFGDKTYLSRAKFDRFEGFNVFAKEKVKVSQTSIYGEIGGYIPGPFKVVDLYAAIGPYYLFTRSYSRFQGIHEKTPAAWGGKLRLAAKAWDGIDFGMDVTYDHVFKWNVQGYISFSYPFGPANTRTEGKRWKRMYKTEKCQRVGDFRQMMTQPVARNEIIPVLEKNLVFALRNTEDAELLLECIFVNNSAPAGGDGSFENPFQFLFEAEDASVPFDCIYVYGDGDIYDVDGPGFILKEGQVITGSAMAFDICGCGIIFPPQTVNAPIIQQAEEGNPPMFTLANNTTIQGLELIRSTAIGIVSAPGSNNFTIQNNTIRDMTDSGILIENLSGGTQVIQNNSFRNNGNGIEYDTVTNANVLIRGNTIENFSSNGIFTVDFGDGTLTIDDNEMTNDAGAVGIQILKTDGGFETGTTTLNVTNNTFTNTAGGSLALLIIRDTPGNTGTTTINITGNDFTNFGQVVDVRSYSDVQTVLMNNNEFTRNDGSARVTQLGTFYDGANMTVDYINNTVTSTGLGGALDNSFAIPNGDTTSTMDVRIQCNTFAPAALPVEIDNGPGFPLNYEIRITDVPNILSSLDDMNTDGSFNAINTFTPVSVPAGCPTTP